MFVVQSSEDFVVFVCNVLLKNVEVSDQHTP